MTRWPLVPLLIYLSLPSEASAQGCTGNAVSVQILGSGGPGLNPDRASTGYVVWVDSKARMLIDMGGGAFHRFAQTQAKFSDLSLIAVSHLHPDHVSDLPALFWSSRLTRKDSLRITGPSGNDAAPNFSAFLGRLFDAKDGAFRVLGPIMPNSAESAFGNVRLDVGVVDVTKAQASTVFDGDGMIVTALGIPHANIPTLAYRVQTRNLSVVFSSDQNGTDPKFVDFAKGANVLIMHLAIAPGVSSPLHATPGIVGRIAQQAGVGRLIVSHIGLFDLAPAIAELKTAYGGPLTVGADLQCTPVE